MADAVTAFASARQRLVNDRAQTLQTRLVNFTGEHRRLVDIAFQAFFAIRAGNVGATATLLVHALGELRSLGERTLPEIHLMSEATTVTAR